MKAERKPIHEQTDLERLARAQQVARRTRRASAAMMLKDPEIDGRVVILRVSPEGALVPAWGIL